jgi:hypothetical protein
MTTGIAVNGIATVRKGTITITGKITKITAAKGKITTVGTPNADSVRVIAITALITR